MQRFHVYWAGPLFDFKALCGNAAAADALESVSNGKYRVVLPQNADCGGLSANDIRDMDLAMVFRSDCLVVNFDGADLDSGTVVEFVCAKMLDIPAVLFRSDYRASGEQMPGGVPWNLMCGGFPRADVLVEDAMALYQRFRGDDVHASELNAAVVCELARKIAGSLDRAAARPSLFACSVERARAVYQWAASCCGESFRSIMTDSEIERIVRTKKDKGLLD